MRIFCHFILCQDDDEKKNKDNDEGVSTDDNTDDVWSDYTTEDDKASARYAITEVVMAHRYSST